MKIEYALSSIVTAGLLFTTSLAVAQVAPVNATGLGSTTIFASKSVASSGSSRVYGDVNISPGAAYSVLPPGFVSGKTELASASASSVASAATALFNDLNSRPCEINLLRDAGNTQYSPSSYCAVADILFRGESTLDALGNPDAVFLFRATSNLTFADNAKFKLVNGAKWQNVYFVSGTYLVVGAGAAVSGTIMAGNNINVNDSAVVIGRLLSRDGSVDLISAVVGTGASADLELSQAVSVTSAPEGDALTYTITVKNSGPDAADNVVVWDGLPQSFELVTTIPSVGKFEGSEWVLGSIASGATQKLDITMRPKKGTQGTTYKNTAEIKSSSAIDPDSLPMNNSQGEDDLATTYVGVLAPRPVSAESSPYFNPTSERDAVPTIDSNTPGALSSPTSVGPVTLPCTPGSLFRGTLPAVYYCTSYGTRLVFPDDRTYKSWYSDYFEVKKISDAAIAKIKLAGVVKYRPGVRLVKIQTDPKVYAVSKNGILRWLSGELIAVQLYGPNWNKMIDDIPDAFFFNYTVGDAITSL